ncbi:MAG: hypothetical protein J6M20_03170 [Clostridia bacterium]|nr:hypothetical protein [Clostridia bacterium]
MLPTQKPRHPGGHRTPHGADPWGIAGKPAPYFGFLLLIYIYPHCISVVFSRHAKRTFADCAWLLRPACCSTQALKQRKNFNEYVFVNFLKTRKNAGHFNENLGKKTLQAQEMANFSKKNTCNLHKKVIA